MYTDARFITGSIWKTRSLTEKTIVIVALFLTVLIYNSYSAFITSILSVEVYSIRSITDLLESDYKIGYAKDSQDEDYLRVCLLYFYSNLIYILSSRSVAIILV